MDEHINIPPVLSQEQKPSFFRKYLYLVILLCVILLIGLIAIVGKRAVVTEQDVKEYSSVQTGIALKYPSNLSIEIKDEYGDPMLPIIFFSTSTSSQQWSRNSCLAKDCILLMGRYEKDINSLYFGDEFKGEFPVYEYPKYVHKDEGGSKSYKINGLDAKRFYVAGLEDGSYGTPKVYKLEERVYITDPYISGRIIEVRYEEFTDKELPDAKTMKSADIKAMFNQEQYQQYQKVLSSISIPQYDIKTATTHKSQLLGIEFNYPAFWGKLIEIVSSAGGFSSFDGAHTYFDSSLYSYSDPNPVSVTIHNSKTAHSYYESEGPIIQYGGEDLKNICNTKSYLNPQKDTYTIHNSTCKLETINGVQVALVDVVSTAIWHYAEEIPKQYQKKMYTKALLMQSRSIQWPGVTFEIATDKEEFTNEEKSNFENLTRSIKYSDTFKGGNLVMFYSGYDEQTQKELRKEISVEALPEMLVGKDSSFGTSMGGGYFKDTQYSPNRKKVAFSVSNGVHDFGWVYDFTTSKFIPLTFQFEGGVDIIAWKSENEVTFKLTGPKPSTSEVTVNLNSLPEYPKLAQ